MKEYYLNPNDYQQEKVLKIWKNLIGYSKLLESDPDSKRSN